MPEKELFRLIPEIGKCYQYAEATREEEDENYRKRYFTTNRLEFVGVCRNILENTYIFSDNVEGPPEEDKDYRIISKRLNPLFREVDCIDEFKYITSQNRVKSLSDLARYKLSTDEDAYVREQGILSPPRKFKKLERGGKRRSIRRSRSHSRKRGKRTFKNKNKK